MEEDKRINFKNKLVKVGIVVAVIAGYWITGKFVVAKMFTGMVGLRVPRGISIDKSYVIGTKVLAYADGKDSCNISVFAIDKGGRGVEGKRVALSGVETVKALGEKTDKDGKISFEVRSESSGQFEVMATIEGLPLRQGVTVTFRK